MKKIITTIFFFSSLICSSQEFRINISGILSDLYYLESNKDFRFHYDYKVMPSYMIGTSLNFRNRHIPLRLDLTYIRIRSKHNLVDDGISDWLFGGSFSFLTEVWHREDMVMNLDYLFISPLYEFDFRKGWFLSIGPQIGYLLDSKRNTHPDTPDGWKSVRINQKFDFGLRICVEKKLMEKISVISDFYNGFGKVETQGNIYLASLYYTRNRYMSLGISYLLSK